MTEFPGEFVRLLMMLSDAAAETGAGVQITLDAIEDDRDVAMLASQIQQLAVDEAFAAGMTAGPSVEVDVGIAPGPGGPVVEEEALMMERM